jgi:hypothetical protein
MQVLREAVDRLGVDLSVDAAVSIVVKEKYIKPSVQHEYVAK